VLKANFGSHTDTRGQRDCFNLLIVCY